LKQVKTPEYEKEKKKSKKEKSNPVHFLMIFHLENSVEMHKATTIIIDKALKERDDKKMKITLRSIASSRYYEYFRKKKRKGLTKKEGRRHIFLALVALKRKYLILFFLLCKNMT